MKLQPIMVTLDNGGVVEDVIKNLHKLKIVEPSIRAFRVPHDRNLKGPGELSDFMNQAKKLVTEGLGLTYLKENKFGS